MLGTDPVVEELPAEPQPVDVPGITVDLDSKKETPKPVALEDLLSELREVKKINQSLDNRVKASYRVTERMQREMDELRRGAAATKPAQPPVPAQLPDDDAQRLSELRPWDKPLRQLAKEEAERLYQEKESVRIQEQAERNRQEEVARSQQFVLSKYADLTNDQSELTDFYLSVVNAHPEWHKDPFGPIRAMLEMERVAAEKGIALPSTSTKPTAPNTEVIRRARANAASLPPGRGLPSSGKITLTKEQENFAKSNRIPVETYAKMVGGISNNGVVEAQ